MTMELDFIMSERARLWDCHPIITESSILPTKPVKETVAKVMENSRKARASMARWADPLSGKSSCLKIIKITVETRIPGCGVLMFEAVEDENPAEGRLLEQILKSLDYAHKIGTSLAGKRDQVKRALVALAGPARHLFILIDEAQEVSLEEFGWLKAVINALTSAGIKVTTVLFGQRELKKRRDELFEKGRSDLGVRFMKTLEEFKRCSKVSELKGIFNACDEDSEFPVGSKWTYTQLLFPKAFASGFRLASLANKVWELYGTHLSPQLLVHGLSMEVIAATLAQLCLLSKDKDGKDFAISDATINEAIEKALAG